MRIPFAFVAACLVFSSQGLASQVPAVAHMPAQKAFDSVPKESAPACLAGSHLLSHAAYAPSAAAPLRCSELLSTDTLIKIHHWDRT